MYEGLYKVMSTPEGKASALARVFRPTEGPAFTSEGYQRNATGPFAANFRGLVEDVDSRDALDLAKLRDSWSAEMHRIGNYYFFDRDQQDAASKELSAREKLADVWFDDPENREKIKRYFRDLDEVGREEGRRGRMSYEVERTQETRKTLEKDRKSLAAPIEAWTNALRDSWKGLATEEQKKTHGEYRPPLTEVQWSDRVTMYGLTLCGLALILGLFTPVAALGASTFLMLFYLSQPPFPGLPVPANAEGHYAFVNKNLIEFLACLALAATPSGLWLGIDALLFGWIDRLRYRREAAREATAASIADLPTGPTVKIPGASPQSRTR